MSCVHDGICWFGGFSLVSECGIFYLCARLEIKVVLAVALKVNLEMMIRETN